MNTSMDTAASLPATHAAGGVMAALAPVPAAPDETPGTDMMTALFEDVLRGAAGAAGLPPAVEAHAWGAEAEGDGSTDDGEVQPPADPALLVPALTAAAAALVLPAVPAAASSASRTAPSPGLAPSAGTAGVVPANGALPGSSLPVMQAPVAAAPHAAAAKVAASAAGNPVPAVAAADAAAASQRASEPAAAALARTEPAAPVAGIAPAQAPAQAPVADGVLPLKASAPSQWRQPLQEALGDRLKLQLQRGSEQAVIRLDPPTLGRIEILVRHEGGNVQVHLSASNGEVLRQLGHIGDSLRQDLVNRQYGDVSVVVSDGSRDAEGRQRQRQGEQQQAPGRALAEADDGEHAGTFAIAADRN